MRLSNEGLEIETENVGVEFPANFILVDWELEADDQYDDIESVPFYTFNHIEITECYYFNSDNEEVDFKPNDEQIIWMTPDIEKDAENELEKQK